MPVALSQIKDLLLPGLWGIDGLSPMIERQWPQLKGQFLIDRDGIVRWSYIECGTEGLAGIGKLPSAGEILAAARSLEGGA